jgi:signal recognition particle subunit SRP19
MPDHFYVYPAYLDKTGSRTDGRRVGAPLAVAEVTVEMIVEAARRLGFTAQAEPDKHYPRQVHRYGGRVKIAKQSGVTKVEAIRRIAKAVKDAAPAAKGS